MGRCAESDERMVVMKRRPSGFGIAITLLGLVIFAKLVFHDSSHDFRRQQMFRQPMPVPSGLFRNPLRDESATNFTSNLPIVVIQTSGRPMSKQAQAVVRAEFFDAVDGRAALAAKPAYAGLGTIHLRGSTTLNLPKRSYTFHTVDRQTNQTKVALLGLPPGEDWVFYAPFEDKSLMRDALAFDLARAMGRYAPRTRFVELFVTASAGPVSMRDYAGVYVLMEKIKRGKDRVNVAKLEAQDQSEPQITGGYIVKRDHADHVESRFNTRRGGPYFFVYPKAQEITPQQRAWLAGYFNAFETALYGNNFKDPLAGYAAYLDVDSFIDAHWLIEASKNVDGFRYSSFLTKDRGGKIKTEPPWDWNRSFGNANYYGGGEPQGWYWHNLRPNEISWYLRLREDPEFVKRCRARWLELRKDVFDPKNIKARIDEMAARLQEAQQRNFRRWPILGEQITCNYYVGESFEDEVRWLKQWIQARIAWIDKQVGRSAAAEENE